MEMTDEMIERYLNGYCTVAESEAADSFFKKNPEILQKYLSRDWEEAGLDKQAIDDNDMTLPAVRKQIPDKDTRKNHSIFIRMARRSAAVAAAVLLAIAGFVFLQSGKDKLLKAGLHSRNSYKPVPASATDSRDWQLNTNITGQKLNITLPDGSVVTLLPKSSIRYARKFTDNVEHTRNVYLKGQAYFDVAKNKTRPFSVFAGNLSTTALGTFFSVHENASGIIVKLYRGKVKIHALHRKNEQKDIFLEPGEQMKYLFSANTATVIHFDNVMLAKKQFREPAAVVPDDMNFSNAPLTEVLDELAKHFHQRISYKKTVLSEMYFSGKVLESDSLPVILKVIGRMNGIQFTETSDGYVTQKSK
jgi:transmembrane sensor